MNEWSSFPSHIMLNRILVIAGKAVDEIINDYESAEY